MCPHHTFVAVTHPKCKDTANVFDNLPALSTPRATELHDELERYLSADLEHVVDILMWWTEQKGMYPCLSRMALDYLSIPATSTDVERVFSKGRILLSHIHNRLSVQLTHALMCLGEWSCHGFVRDDDVNAATVQPEIDVEGLLALDCDRI